MLNGYQKSLNNHLRRVPISGPPSPWLHLTTIHVGGLAAVGFSSDEEYLLIVSSSGRGVFELPSGSRVGRDNDSTWSWFDLEHLRVRALPPVQEEFVSVAGIHGGGLPKVTQDGWTLEIVAPDWPNEFVFLSPSGSSALDMRDGKRTYNLGPGPEGDCILVFGFSPSRRYFIFATSSELELFGRESSAG